MKAGKSRLWLKPLAGLKAFDAMACQGEIVYLHGWSGHPSCDKLTESLPDGIVLTLLTYHPGGNIQETKIKSFLEELRSRALNNAPFLALVGYSFGGLLAALYQEKFPHLVNPSRAAGTCN